MTIVKVLASLLLLAGIGYGAFWGVYSLRSDEAATAQKPPRPSPPTDAQLEEEARQPRFRGEVLGIYIAPPGASVPDKFLTAEELCGFGESSVQVPWDRAGELDLSLQLPPQYRLNEQSLNTGVIACGDKVYAARREFEVTLESLYYPASVLIGSSVFSYDTVDVAENRVKPTTIAGRDAVLIEPLIPSGLVSPSRVVFPADFGSVFIMAIDLPLTDLLDLAEIVAKAIR
jgi:hypothetical protein